MDYKHNIIQWNCRGLKTKLDEISLLLIIYKPSVFCLQETFLKPEDDITLKDFNIYMSYVYEVSMQYSDFFVIIISSIT